MERIQGLQNLGNTCYMNSTIQLLAQCPPLLSLLECLHISCRSTIHHSMFGHLIMLLKGVRNQFNKIDPEPFLLNFAALHSFFRGKQQHDAFEFLTTLLGDIDDQLHIGSSSPTTDIFQGSTEQIITCKTCSTVYRREQSFLDLSLNIPLGNELVQYSQRSAEFQETDDQNYIRQRNSKKFNKIKEFFSTGSGTTISLYDCLLQMTELSQFSDGDLYNCENCDCLTPATHQTLIKRTPNYLVVVLKRFAYERQGAKINRYVHFPKNLRLNQFSLNKGSAEYNLLSLVVHSGTLNRGHYVNYCKIEDRWFRCSDNRITEVHYNQVRQQQAFLLLYQIKSTKQQVPTGAFLVPQLWHSKLEMLPNPGPLSFDGFVCKHFRLTQIGAEHPWVEIDRQYLLNSNIDHQEINFTPDPCDQCQQEHQALITRIRLERNLLISLGRKDSPSCLYPIPTRWFSQ